MNRLINYTLIFILFIILIFFSSTMLKKCYEPFTSLQKETLDLYNTYIKDIYPLQKNISVHEKDFIEKSLHKITDEDIKTNEHISPYSYSCCINKTKNKTNFSRFNIGNKSNQDEFGRDVQKLLNKLEIKLEKPEMYNWYGIGWDLEENIFKVSFLHKNNNKILCYVYNIEREGKKIKNIELVSNKIYIVRKDKTIMFKDGKSINQYNVKNKMDISKYKKKYPEINKIIYNMNKKGFHIDSYSEYDNKLNLYFD